MKKKRNVHLVVAVLLLAVLAWFAFYSPGDEALLRDLLEDVCSLVEKDGEEKALTTGIRANSLSSCFTVDCDLRLSGGHRSAPDIRGAHDLTRQFALMRHMCTSIDLNFTDVTITIESDATRAKASLTGTLKVDSSVVSGTLVREAEIEFVKVEGTWRIATVLVKETLR